jgi:cyanophycinase-like exopeptidase
MRLVPWLLRWGPGLGFAPGISVVPHYDAWPEPFSALIALQAPRGSVVLGIDEETAVIGRDGSWQVHGAARVTVWRGRHRERFRAGETFRI